MKNLPSIPTKYRPRIVPRPQPRGQLWVWIHVDSEPYWEADAIMRHGYVVDIVRGAAKDAEALIAKASAILHSHIDEDALPCP